MRSERAKAPRSTKGSQLIHDLGGTLATISLHLQMLATDELPESLREHVDQSLQALRLSRRQLSEIAETLGKVSDRSRGERRRSR